ncbi:uncharacterized protein LOC129596868 isoform X1 [Paramacrobiotus metropolitanus]|uniref:uncharacterized protein LOC129596868 isoform X1 n=1 Tax=Paramacrobiotus metropolitanus TaxID=2943436 RepID=UPI002446201A|nr:uncharacterized protein LOC129596868 isoform X1 [Paramacrobiotus metropolitanus]
MFNYMTCLILLIFQHNVFAQFAGDIYYSMMQEYFVNKTSFASLAPELAAVFEGALTTETTPTTTTTTTTTTTPTTTPCPTCHISGRQYCEFWYTYDHPCYDDPFMVLKEREDLDCVERHVRGGARVMDPLSKVSWATDRDHLGLWYHIPVMKAATYDENHEKLYNCSVMNGIAKRDYWWLACESQCYKEVAFFQDGRAKLPKTH